MESTIKTLTDLAPALQALLLLSAVWLAIETRGQRRATSNNTELLRRQLLGQIQPHLGFSIEPAPADDKDHRWVIQFRNHYGGMALQARAVIWDSEQQHFLLSDLGANFLTPDEGRSREFLMPNKAYLLEKMLDQLIKHFPGLDRDDLQKSFSPPEKSTVYMVYNDVNGVPYIAWRWFTNQGSTIYDYSVTHNKPLKIVAARRGIFNRIGLAIDRALGIDPKV